MYLLTSGWEEQDKQTGSAAWKLLPSLWLVAHDPSSVRFVSGETLCHRAVSPLMQYFLS